MTAEVGLHVAAGVAASFGFVMPPAVGKGLMSLSTIIAAANARLLGRMGSRLTS